MSDFTYIKLKNQSGGSCIPFTTARYLTIALPELPPAYQDTTLHLQVRWSLDNISDPLDTTSKFDTGESIDNRVRLFTGSTWLDMPEYGYPQTYANCRVLFDAKGIDPDSYIYYSWYYVDDGITVHITPWASTKLTATSGIPKHSELQDRDKPNQHTIESITGLTEALANTGAVSRDYQQVCIKTDEDMLDIAVDDGKIITFVGYTTGRTDGAICMRYKTADNTFGTLVGDVHADITNGDLIINNEPVTESDVDEEEQKLFIEDENAYVEPDEQSMTLEGSNYIADSENNTLYMNY